MIAVLTDPAVGGTFLTWSLHFLAGHKRYYHAETYQWIDLPADPLSSKNAHGFSPNQPNSAESFDLIYSALRNKDTDDFHTIYFHNFTGSTVSFDKQISDIVSNLACDHRIVLYNKHSLYHRSYKMRSRVVTSWHDPSKKIANDDEAFDDFISYFFQESMDLWGNSSLNNIWDLREFLALNLPINQDVSILPNIDCSHDSYRLDSMELYNTFDVSVDNLFDYLGVTIDQDRRTLWNPIYNKWRKLHYDRMLFVWYFDEIVDSIINGNNIDLTRFNLDIIQEASIQQELIYTHNLNLKTWQLEKFTSTQQLHQLLEPNIHDLSKKKSQNHSTVIQ